MIDARCRPQAIARDSKRLELGAAFGVEATFLHFERPPQAFRSPGSVIAHSFGHQCGSGGAAIVRNTPQSISLRPSARRAERLSDSWMSATRNGPHEEST